MYMHWQIKLNVIAIIILNNHRSLQRHYFPQAPTPSWKADCCMHVPHTHSDIIIVLLYVHERAKVLYHAHLVSDRNSSDPNNNRLAL